MSLEKMEILSRFSSKELQDFDKSEYEKKRVEWLNETVGNLQGYECKLCKNKGYIVVLDDGKMVSKDCQCTKARRCIRKMKESGLKDVIRKYTFDNFEALEEWQKVIKDKAIAYSKTPVGWFLLAGQSGCGKTHLCTAISCELLRNNKAVTYIQWRDFAPKVKAASMDNEKRFLLMDEPKKAEFTYIDDLFKGGQTVTDIQIAFEIMNHRIVNDLPTIISTELAFEELHAIDEALCGRMVQNAGDNCLFISKNSKKNYRYKNIQVI